MPGCTMTVYLVKGGCVAGKWAPSWVQQSERRHDVCVHRSRRKQGKLDPDGWSTLAG